jgi:hypothetical protein
MQIEKLNNSHIEALRPIFTKGRYMGTDLSTNHFMESDAEFLTIAYNAFCDTYLSDLSSYHAYGSIEDNIVTSYVSFHESSDTPDWYGTQFRCITGKGNLQYVLDAVIKHNEANGRMKFFSLFNKKYTKGIRKFMFSDWANNRYDSFDEFIIPPRTRCVYQTHWQVLFNRTLVPVESIIRCTYLKPEYRIITPIAGFL